MVGIRTFLRHGWWGTGGFSGEASLALSSSQAGRMPEMVILSEERGQGEGRGKVPGAAHHGGGGGYKGEGRGRVPEAPFHEGQGIHGGGER